MEKFRNVYIVDDDRAARTLISECLISCDFDVRSFDQLDFIDLAPRLSPGCAIIEIFPHRVPNFKPLEIALSRHHAMPSIAMCEDCTIELGIKAIKLGAIDVYEKRNPIAGLISVVENAVSSLPTALENDAALLLTIERISTLPRRQFQVLKLISEGHLSKDVANELNVSVRTVEIYRDSIIKRLDCKRMWNAVLMLQSVVGEEKIADRYNADFGAWNKSPSSH